MWLLMHALFPTLIWITLVRNKNKKPYHWCVIGDGFANKSIVIRGSQLLINPDSKVYGANMGPTWVLSAPDGPHVGPMNLAIRECLMYTPGIYVIIYGNTILTEDWWQLIVQGGATLLFMAWQPVSQNELDFHKKETDPRVQAFLWEQ